MKTAGLESISSALEESGISVFQVTPYTVEVEAVQRVVVAVDPDTETARVEEVLGLAGLMEDLSLSKKHQQQARAIAQAIGLPQLQWRSSARPKDDPSRKLIEFVDNTTTTDYLFFLRGLESSLRGENLSSPPPPAASTAVSGS